MEENILKSIVTEEMEILSALMNRLFDLPYRLDESDKRGDEITKWASTLRPICDEMRTFAEKIETDED